MEFDGKDLTTEQLVKIFEDALYEVKPFPEEDPKYIWIAELCINFYYDLKNEYLRFYIQKWSQNDRAQLIALCNKINESISLISVSCGDEKDEDGEYRLFFQYDYALYPDDRVTNKTLVRMARRVSSSIDYAISKCDDDNLIM